MAAGFALYLAVICGMTIVSYPILLRSGLMQDFKAGFSGRFLLDFVKKVGWSLLGSILLVGLISIPLILVGYVALFVGAYLFATWLNFVVYHLVFQHYDLYLERGGGPIEIDPLVTADLGRPLVPEQRLPPPPSSQGE